MNRQSRQAGFTLLEVIVALALLAAIAASRQGAGSGQIDNSDYRYTVEVSEQDYPGEARAFELMHVQLTLSWGEGKYGTDISLEALKTQVKPL